MEGAPDKGYHRAHARPPEKGRSRTPDPEIDWELTEMLNEGIDSLEKEGSMSASEVRRYLEESALRRAGEREKRKGKR